MQHFWVLARINMLFWTRTEVVLLCMFYKDLSFKKVVKIMEQLMLTLLLVNMDQIEDLSILFLKQK